MTRAVLAVRQRGCWSADEGLANGDFREDPAAQAVQSSSFPGPYDQQQQAASHPDGLPGQPGQEGEVPGKQVSTGDIQRVQNYIERCLQLYLSQKEVRVSSSASWTRLKPLSLRTCDLSEATIPGQSDRRASCAVHFNRAGAHACLLCPPRSCLTPGGNSVENTVEFWFEPQP